MSIHPTTPIPGRIDDTHPIPNHGLPTRDDREGGYVGARSSQCSAPHHRWSVVRRLSGHQGQLAILVVFLLALLSGVFPPLERNQNFRLSKLNRAAWHIARGEDYARVLTQSYAGYDIGTPLTLAVLMKTTMTADELAAGPPSQPPALFQMANRILFAAAVAILFAALCRLTTPLVAAAMAVLLLLSPNWRFIAYSDDVYVFPAYAFAATLAGIAIVNSKHRLAWPGILICGAAIGASCMFRSVSILCLGSVVAVGLFPGTFLGNVSRPLVRRRTAALTLVAVVVAIAPGILARSPGHVFWHPMHCGLGEFGGYEDAQARLYPWFVPASDLPPDATPIEDWSDDRSFRRVRLIDSNIIKCSPAYESIMRSDYYDNWRRYPVGMVRTYAARLKNVLTLNPAQSHTADSRILRTPADTFALAAFLAMLVIAWRTRLNRRAWLMLAVFSPMLVAPLIAHSGYIMYNAPARLPFYVFAFWTFQHACRRFGVSSKRNRTAPAPTL